MRSSPSIKAASKLWGLVELWGHFRTQRSGGDPSAPVPRSQGEALASPRASGLLSLEETCCPWGVTMKCLKKLFMGEKPGGPAAGPGEGAAGWWEKTTAAGPPSQCGCGAGHLRVATSVRWCDVWVRSRGNLGLKHRFRISR